MRITYQNGKLFISLRKDEAENVSQNIGKPSEIDLGNIVVRQDGTADFNLKTSKITLYGKNSIIGRSIVVHEDQDDLGKGGFPDSLTTGHAGARIDCAVIGYAS